MSSQEIKKLWWTKLKILCQLLVRFHWKKNHVQENFVLILYMQSCNNTINKSNNENEWSNYVFSFTICQVFWKNQINAHKIWQGCHHIHISYLLRLDKPWRECMDEAVGRLMEGLYKRNMHNCANIIIIADHGIRI